MIIISADSYNHGPADLILVVPITSTQRGILYHVPVSPPEAGLARPGDILCDAVRSIAKARLERRLGVISPTSMAQVEHRLRLLQGL